MSASAFSATTGVTGLTRFGVEKLTGLEWVPVTTIEALPTEAGIYGWFTPDEDEVLHYHGRGTSGLGLRKRLGDQISWVASQRLRVARNDEGPDEDTLWAVLNEVPVIRQIEARGLKAFYAIVKPAPWTVPITTEPPVEADEWESFLSAASHLQTGTRSILGGGAWEYKIGSLAHRMTQVAHERLLDLSPLGQRLYSLLA